MANDLIPSSLGLFAPPQRYNVATWAEAFRELPLGTSAEPGKWRNSRLPYLTEPMESFTDPTVAETILMFGKQMGKTELLINCICYVIDVDPGNLLFKAPTLDTVKRFSQKKLATVLRETSRLRGRVQSPRSRDSGNTVYSKLFPGGSLSMVGANSAAGLRQLSCRWILQDEIDSDQPNAEGDPVSQADGRAENFGDAVFIKASTPTIRGGSRIAQLYEDSDQRRWNVSCPRCGHWQILLWSNVRWRWSQPDGTMKVDPAAAVYVCDKCAAELTDFERVRMVMGGRWTPQFPGRRRRGYHLSGLYRIMGKKSTFSSYLHEFVERYLEAEQGGPDKIRFWTNTFLTETYELKLETIATDPIMQRREAYGPALPSGVLVLLCGVDVQKDRLEYQVKGLGLKDETWGIEFGFLVGNPLRPEVWKALDDVLAREWIHPLAGKLKIVTTVIDSGGQADDQAFADPVYRFVRPRQPSENGPGVYAVKGASKAGSQLLSNRRPKQGVCLKLIGTSIAKTTLHQRLKLSDPGPRFMHYPVGYGFDHEFFEQLGAEAPKQVTKRGYTFIEWHKIRPRNEALDIEVYLLAAIEILGADLPAIARKFATATPGKPTPPAAKTPPVVYTLHRPGGRPRFRPRFQR